MKKKAAAKVQRYSSKTKKMDIVTKRIRTNKGADAAAPRRPSLHDDPRFAQAVQNYEAGLKAMQERKFERAKPLLEKTISSGSRELADRAALHLNTCLQQLARSATGGFKSQEEHYDYAISLVNAGDYGNARDHLDKLQKQNPKADYPWYGLAILDCLTKHYESALKNLEEAIRRNRANRFYARNESDFKNMADDPRFTELLYPEPGTEIETPDQSPAIESSTVKSSKRR